MGLRRFFNRLTVSPAINKAGADGETLLTAAIKLGHSKTVFDLLEAGARIEAANTLGETPLLLAVKTGHRHIFRLLIEAGASVHTTHSGKSLAQVAQDFGQSDMQRMLQSIIRSENNHLEALSASARAGHAGVGPRKSRKAYSWPNGF